MLIFGESVSCEADQHFSSAIMATIKSLSIVSQLAHSHIYYEFTNIVSYFGSITVIEKIMFYTGYYYRMSNMQDYKYHQGLSHSFLRHYDQWMLQIATLRPLMDHFDTIRSQLEDVTKAANPRARRKAQSALKNAITRLEAHDLEILINAFIEVDQKIFDYIHKIIDNKSTKLAHGRTHEGKLVEYFRAEHNNQVMVICPSKEIYDSNMRKIITVYFIPWTEYEKKLKRGCVVSETTDNRNTTEDSKPEDIIRLGSLHNVTKLDDDVYLTYIINE